MPFTHLLISSSWTRNDGIEHCQMFDPSKRQISRNINPLTIIYSAPRLKGGREGFYSWVCAMLQKASRRGRNELIGLCGRRHESPINSFLPRLLAIYDLCLTTNR